MLLAGFDALGVEFTLKISLIADVVIGVLKAAFGNGFAILKSKGFWSGFETKVYALVLRPVVGADIVGVTEPENIFGPV